jgi:hypothetical protein
MTQYPTHFGECLRRLSGPAAVIVDGTTKAFNARNRDMADDARIVFGIRRHR